MDLAKRCFQEFDSRDWRRGQEYFQRGAVSIYDQDSASLEAGVKGSDPRPYDVRIDWSQARKKTLRVYCSCPRFDDVGLCKHVAATILAADEEGLGRMVPGTGGFFLKSYDFEPADRDRYDLEDTDEDDDEGGFDGRGGGNANGLYTKGALPSRVSTATRRGREQRRAKPRAAPMWKKNLAQLGSLQASAFAAGLDAKSRTAKQQRQICYVLDLERTKERGLPFVALRQRTIKKDGSPGKLRAAKVSKADIVALESAEDRTLLELLAGNERDLGYSYAYGGFSSFEQFSGFGITPSMFEVLLPRLCASGRFGWLDEDGLSSDDELHPLSWDDGPSWKLRLDVRKTSDHRHWRIQGTLERGEQAEDLTSPLVLLAKGLVVFPDCVARFEASDGFPWVLMLRQSGPLLVPVKQEVELIEQLAQMPSLPAADWPDELRWEDERMAPLPRVSISKPKGGWHRDLECHLTFQYGDFSVSLGGGQPAWFDRRSRRAVRRDLEAELAAQGQLLRAGAQRHSYYSPNESNLFFVSPAKMPQLVLQLASAGWEVEAEGSVVRQPGQMTISVTSGVDWFDLEAKCDFGGETVDLPKLLAALRQGERYVRLDDGSQGILPSEWLARYAPLAELAKVEGDRLRFMPTQAALLDALLAAQESQPVTVDDTFAKLRDRLRSFEGIEPRREPKTFVGELRHYQREGLGWLHFLDDFGFGGCLADDMGLGKTVQILALLDERREAAGRSPARRRAREVSHAPSLVVVPRSLIFNWMEEARRFTPKLRVLDYTGLDRGDAFDRLKDHDLIVTTYGTLRRDIGKLREFDFDYAILDEAQAIKNPSSQAAKACRLLRARRRVTVTGTPVENHLGELWSLFEFLNPGMLGRSQKLNQLFTAGRGTGRANGAAGNEDERPKNVAILARALRPFLLRRTKQQVLTELPAKTEQTLYCELDASERKLYDELREHYRRTLLHRVNDQGLKKSAFHVLEALLRLRQAACHPGLLDKKKIDGGSSKLETLLEQLTEVIDGGHKALVFSQFTSLLAIVRRQLDRRGVVYEYLDGRTVKRQAKVQRFQTDAECPLFLISLKAGGQGLNLTAADYVFILDPWWNPAVEAQAVDRAHRIGQHRNVFAYRLIARDTVEEKILQLQEHKRGLAEAIVSADNSLLRNLTVEDLQLLLS